MAIEVTDHNNYAKVRIYSMIRGSIFDIRCSNIEPYRISNLIEPLEYSINRTIEYRTIEPHRISNLFESFRYSIRRTIEYRISNPWSNIEIFDRSNRSMIEPVRWSNIRLWFDDSIFDDRISNFSNHRIFEGSVTLLQILNIKVSINEIIKQLVTR